MSVSRANLADFVYFLAIARHQSFSRAGQEVGISASALSHAIKGLETRIGVRLLNRTTRSVTLTDAGERLHQVICTPMKEIDDAMEILNKFRDEPTGRIRLNILSDAADLLLGPVLPIFMERYPQIQVDLTVTNLIVDVIGGGHDAGIRYGGTVPEDMIASNGLECPSTLKICTTIAACASASATARCTTGSSKKMSRSSRLQFLE
jgi:DNA-binding transcriptional LysR family regulator